ncbi:MAG TPA: MMPL family transporter [Ktedonobacterales bacterium]
MLLDTSPAEAHAPRDTHPAASASSPDGEHPHHGRWYRAGLAYGRLVHRLRWLILVLWIAGLAAAVPFAAQVSSMLHSGGYSTSGSESAQVQTVLQDTLKRTGTAAVVVFQSSGTPVADPGYQAELAAFEARARAFPHVSSVTDGGVGQDGNTTYLVVGLDESESAAQQAMPAFEELLPSSGDGPARAYLTGAPETQRQFSSIVQHDVEHAELVSLPIALVVLLIVFGTLVAALMPLLLAVVAVPVALAAIYGVAAHTWTSIFVLNVASVIGLGIAIDYSLFMVRRFREELARGRNVREAVAWTVATTGEAILFSGMTVIVGFCGLLLIGIPFMRSFGIGGALVVGAAVLAALTLLPALLGILGPRVNALRVPIVWRLTAPRAREGLTENAEVAENRGGRGGDTDSRSTTGGFWSRWALGVMRRPVLVVVATVVLLAALSWPIFSIRLSAYGAASLPASTQAQQGTNILKAQFPSAANDPIEVVARTPDGSSMLAPANLERVEALTEWMLAQPHVTGVTSLTHLPADPTASQSSGPNAAPASPTYEQLVALYSSGAYAHQPALARLVAATTSGGTTLITVTTDAPLDSTAGTALVDALRAGDTQAAQGLRVQVGGTQAASLDFTRQLYANFPRAILFILLATYLLLLLMFRSALLPLKAVLVNVLSLGAAYGVLVFVFQWGHFSDLLHFTSAGALDSTTPILIFCILFGLSMDYEVFLLSRIREEWLRTGDNRLAVARGLEKTAGVITNAALLFVIVTGAFTFTSLLTTQEIGLGMTVAVLVDATIIRTLLVPATMRLLGKWNWWLPGRRLQGT